jgi:hypothetical protein
MPDLWQNDSNATRYEDQEVRRSNTELTDEGSQGDRTLYPLNADLVSCWGGGGGGGGGGAPVWVVAIKNYLIEGSW